MSKPSVNRTSIGGVTRRNELRATRPIGRVVGPADVAALAVHVMSNTALTGATYDIDGGQQLVS
jgi:NAD(P)-dependent dehydrogenase (short-subunit alcohol dehydrogenase family)